MTTYEDEYRALRSLAPVGRWQWLQQHAPAELRGQWWLGLIECAEFDAGPARRLPPDEVIANMEFAVDLIEMAQLDGMPHHYVASRLALLTSAVLKSGGTFDGLPASIAPDNLARRILATFSLGKEQALAIASRVRAAGVNEPASIESKALSDMTWVLPDLQMLAPHISDDALALEVREWLDISRILLAA